jgi:hypothetical protein
MVSSELLRENRRARLVIIPRRRDLHTSGAPVSDTLAGDAHIFLPESGDGA